MKQSDAKSQAEELLKVPVRLVKRQPSVFRIIVTRYVSNAILAIGNRFEGQSWEDCIGQIKAMLHYAPKDNPELAPVDVKAIEEIEEKIANGEVTVPDSDEELGS